jgi:serine/threonine protein kinase
VTGAVLGGRYALGDLLGRGGMAEVYRARDTVLDREVAVKVFRHVESSGPDSEARRTSEVHLLASLSHPGLVTVFDAGSGSDSPGDAFAYLVMEYVEGTTLRNRLDSGPLPPVEAARIGERLATALAYVHERGIVHRDVKPANILLTTDGTPKLTDFGVARLLDSTRLTIEGTTLGTPNYLSPEQVIGSAVSGVSDVYALGLVLLECLTGEVAFRGQGVEAAVVRLHRAPTVPEQFGPEWADLLYRMTDRDPAARPDAAAVAATLATMTGTRPVATAATTQLLVVPTPSARRSRWLAVAIGGTVAGIAALAAVLVITAGDGSAPPIPGSPSSTVPAAQHSSSSDPAPTTPATTPSTPTSSRTSTAAPPPPPGKTKPPKDKGPGKGPGKEPGKGHKSK